MSKVFSIAVLIINGKEIHSVDTADVHGLDLIESFAREHRDARGHHVELVRRSASRWAGKDEDGFIAFGAWN